MQEAPVLLLLKCSLLLNLMFRTALTPVQKGCTNEPCNFKCVVFVSVGHKAWCDFPKHRSFPFRHLPSWPYVPIPPHFITQHGD